MIKSAWNMRFLAALADFLAEHQERGALTVNRVEVLGGRLVTVLQVPAESGHRFGRVVNLEELRSQFSPDTPSAVADAWMLTIYPPSTWKQENVSDEICWFNGKMK
jgi:hypothetical protein